MRSLLMTGSAARLLVASLMAICLTSPDAYGQARGGGRISTREDINRAEGGGGLQGIATNQAQAGGGLTIQGGAGASAGGGLTMGDSGAASAGGGLAATGKGAEGGPGAGGDLLGDEGTSQKGGGIAAADEGNFVRSVATWVPIIGAVALGLAAWFLRNMKGKGV